MVYDLASEDVRLTLQITQRPNDDGQGGWLIEAHTRPAPEAPTVNEPGTTRDEALRAVARSWRAKDGAISYPSLDWEAVSDAMRGVRAI